MIFVLWEGVWYQQSQTIDTINTYKYLRLHTSAVTYQLFRTSCYLFAHSHGTIKIRTFPKIYLNIMKYVAGSLTWFREINMNESNTADTTNNSAAIANLRQD